MRILLILILICVTNRSLGQLIFLPNNISKPTNKMPDKLWKVTQYENGVILNIRIYDTLRNEIFSHYKQYWSNQRTEYLTMISGEIYNANGLLEKSYNLHSNAGLSIWYYEYDSIGNNIKTFKRDNQYEHYDSLINTNPYSYVSEINDIHQLSSHPKILEIERLAEKKLLWEQKFDSNNNIIEEITFESNGDTSSVILYEYDSLNNVIYTYTRDRSYELYLTYKHYHSYPEGRIGNKKTESNLVQSVRIDYDSRDHKKEINQINFYKYDTKNRLIKEIEYEDGAFQSGEYYKYNNKNLVIKKLFYIYDDKKPAIIRKYKYNKEGYVISEYEKNLRTNEKQLVKYKYHYEYYK